MLGVLTRPYAGICFIATNLNVNIFLQTYSMDCYFRQSWVDLRLAFKTTDYDTLALSISMLAKIWKPDTYFYNGEYGEGLEKNQNFNISLFSFFRQAILLAHHNDTE
jgi:Neurotransmitter-gated ion-channel ligand binding domain